MVKHPHILTVTVPPQAVLGTNGEYVVEDSIESYTTACRAEGNPRGAFKTLVDGRQYVYQGVVYMPLEASNLPTGAMISVVDSTSSTILSGQIKAFQREQKGCRVWV